jgi:hypothetical protein
MGYLPSRDHKGAEYKESFMFSNRSSVSHGCSIAAAALATMALVGLAGTASAGIIYQDGFTGSNGTPLNGAAPTIDNGPSSTWTAASAWTDSGYINYSSGGREAAYLSFTPAAGYIYTLSAGLDILGMNAADQNHGDYWMGLGYLTSQSTTDAWDNGGAQPWVMTSYEGNFASVQGPGMANQQNAYIQTTSGANTMSLVLNTGSPTWSYDWYVTNSLLNDQLAASGTFNTNPAITAVGFEMDGQGIDRVSNFSLTGITVPEPTTLGLFAVGTTLLLAGSFGKRKRRYKRSQ